MRIYWKVFFNEEERFIGRRWERLVFLQQIIKKKLPRKILSSKVWFFGVEKKEIFNPFEFIDDEKYLETLRIWKERKLLDFIEKNPSLSIRGYRHEKNFSYKRPIRL